MLWLLKVKLERNINEQISAKLKQSYSNVPYLSKYSLLIGDVAEAVRHARTIRNQIRHAQALDSAELFTYAKELRVPFELLKKTAEMGRLPVVNFAAGGLGKYWFVSLLISMPLF